MENEGRGYDNEGSFVEAYTLFKPSIGELSFPNTQQYQYASIAFVNR